MVYIGIVLGIMMRMSNRNIKDERLLLAFAMPIIMIILDTRITLQHFTLKGKSFKEKYAGFTKAAYLSIKYYPTFIGVVTNLILDSIFAKKVKSRRIKKRSAFNLVYKSYVNFYKEDIQDKLIIQ
jgi:hypothetical protein